ncbi:sigma factor [Amycolatopsis samaneae]|uniref:Sigma factor n=1 Tax=Amycolatopsis samaneae TaxID=664691 RepID=A0ABW5GKG2_9PSEU
MLAKQHTSLEWLLARVGAGDESAFTDLYHRLTGPIFATTLRCLRSRTQAEEVTQEVLLEIWRKAAGFHPGRGSARTWALTIAHRRAIDRVRTERQTSTAPPEPACWTGPGPSTSSPKPC